MLTWLGCCHPGYVISAHFSTAASSPVSSMHDAVMLAPALRLQGPGLGPLLRLAWSLQPPPRLTDPGPGPPVAAAPQGAFTRAFAPHGSSASRPGRACRCLCATRTSACPSSPACRSSWWAPARAWRPSAASCRSDRRWSSRVSGERCIHGAGLVRCRLHVLRLHSIRCNAPLWSRRIACSRCRAAVSAQAGVRRMRCTRLLPCIHAR